MKITLPDGSIRELAVCSSGLDLASDIGPGLAKAAIAVTVNGIQKDLTDPIEKDSEVSIITIDSEDGIEIMRHTLTAQVLARAVKNLYPESKLAIGPTINDGFYYDFEFKKAISPDDLASIEKEMRSIISNGSSITKSLHSKSEAMNIFKGEGETYKESIIDNIKDSYLQIDNTSLKAINTIVRKNDSITFDNTDTKAIMYFMKNVNTVILGTGGAAIGAIEATLKKNIKNITVIGRNADKLCEINKKYQVNTCTFELYHKLDDEHNIINCLPPNVNISSYINNSSFLIDMTYGIHNHNSNIINGYDILYVQAAYQFICWFDGYELENIISDYKEAINSFLSQKYKLFTSLEY